MGIEERLKDLGLTLPPPRGPLASYIPVVQVGDIIYVSGTGPMTADGLAFEGKIDADVSVEDGYQAARLTALNLLANVKAYLGDLDRIERIVKVLGFVASSPGFNRQPEVINGASDLFVQVLGDKGKHARSALGTSELPRNMPVEIELIAQIKGGNSFYR